MPWDGGDLAISSHTNPGLFLIAALGLALILLAILTWRDLRRPLALVVAGLATFVSPLTMWPDGQAYFGWAILAVIISGILAMIEALRLSAVPCVIALLLGLALVTMPFWFILFFFVT